jgi:hypothetical protein
MYLILSHTNKRFIRDILPKLRQSGKLDLQSLFAQAFWNSPLCGLSMELVVNTPDLLGRRDPP